MSKKKLPNKVFILRENSGTQDEFLLVEENIEDHNDGEIGMYELTRVVKKTTQTLVDGKVL